MSEATLLFGRRMTHATLRGLSPLCGSRARIEGFSYSAVGEFEVSAGIVPCKHCFREAGLEIVEPTPEPDADEERDDG